MFDKTPDLPQAPAILRGDVSQEAPKSPGPEDAVEILAPSAKSRPKAKSEAKEAMASKRLKNEATEARPKKEAKPIVSEAKHAPPIPPWKRTASTGSAASSSQQTASTGSAASSSKRSQPEVPKPPEPPARYNAEEQWWWCMHCNAFLQSDNDDWCYRCWNWGRPRVKTRDGKGSTRIKGQRGGRSATPIWHALKDKFEEKGCLEWFLAQEKFAKPKDRAADKALLDVWNEL